MDSFSIFWKGQMRSYRPIQVDLNQAGFLPLHNTCNMLGTKACRGSCRVTTRLDSRFLLASTSFSFLSLPYLFTTPFWSILSVWLGEWVRKMERSHFSRSQLLPSGLQHPARRKRRRMRWWGMISPLILCVVFSLSEVKWNHLFGLHAELEGAPPSYPSLWWWRWGG